MNVFKISLTIVLACFAFNCKNTEQVNEKKVKKDVNDFLNEKYTFSEVKYLNNSYQLSNEDVESYSDLIKLYSHKDITFDITGKLASKTYLGTSVKGGYKNEFNVKDVVIESFTEAFKKDLKLDDLVVFLGSPEINELLMEEVSETIHVWFIANVDDFNLYQIFAFTSDTGKIKLGAISKGVNK